MISRHALIWALLALSGAFLVLGLLRTENTQLHADIKALRGALADCKAAANIISEDEANDATVDPDNLPDFGDLNPSWLRGEN